MVKLPIEKLFEKENKMSGSKFLSEKRPNQDLGQMMSNGKTNEDASLLGKRTTAQVQPKPKQSLLEADQQQQDNK